MSSSKIQFHQINLQHNKSATMELNRANVFGNNNIFFIQEPYVYRNKIKGINLQKSTLIADMTITNPRACILISKNCNVFPLIQFCSRDLVAASLKIKISGSERQIIISSAYMPSEIDILPPSPELINLCNFCKTKNLPLLIGSDANSHHLVWGSTNTNPKGEALFDFIISSNLMVLNKGKEPTFINSIIQEVLDISLCSMHIAHLIKDWRVSNDILTSDHRCIKFHINTDKAERKVIRNPKNTDWTLFNQLLEENLTPINGPIRSKSELDKVTEVLVDELLRFYHQVCPFQSFKEGRSAAFFNTNIKKLRRNVRKAFNAAKSLDPALINFRRKAQKVYSNALRRSKRISDQQLLNSTTSISGTAKLLKSLSKDPMCSIGSLKLPSGEFTDSPEATLRHLLDAHFPGSVTPENQVCPISDLFNLPMGRGDLNLAHQIVSLNKIN